MSLSREQTSLCSLAFGEGSHALRRLEGELLAQFLRVCGVPIRIKSLSIAQEFFNPHPTRQVWLFREVANLPKHGDRLRYRIVTKHAHASRFRPQQAENVFDECGFAGPVF